MLPKFKQSDPRHEFVVGKHEPTIGLVLNCGGAIGCPPIAVYRPNDLHVQLRNTVVAYLQVPSLLQPSASREMRSEDVEMPRCRHVHARACVRSHRTNRAALSLSLSLPLSRPYATRPTCRSREIPFVFRSI